MCSTKASRLSAANPPSVMHLSLVGNNCWSDPKKRRRRKRNCNEWLCSKVWSMAFRGTLDSAKSYSFREISPPFQSRNHFLLCGCSHTNLVTPSYISVFMWSYEIIFQFHDSNIRSLFFSGIGSAPSTQSGCIFSGLSILTVRVGLLLLIHQHGTYQRSI